MSVSNLLHPNNYDCFMHSLTTAGTVFSETVSTDLLITNEIQTSNPPLIVPGFVLPTTGGTASTLDFYQVETVATTTVGLSPNVNINLRIVRIGAMFVVQIPSFTSTTTASTVTIAVLPARYRPSSKVVFSLTGNLSSLPPPSNGSFYATLQTNGTLTLANQSGQTDPFSAGDTLLIDGGSQTFAI